MEREQVEALRLNLLANGYSPIRNIDKRTFMSAWPTTIIDEEEIKKWSRKFSRQTATGLRVENGLCVIDYDVDDRAVMDKIIDAVLAEYPDLEEAMVRTGKGAKEAWFLRCDEIFTRLHTRAFIAPGTTADDGTHRVEIFGGGSPRQFGAFGAHTIDERTGVARVSYDWVGLDGKDHSPLSVPLADVLEVEKNVLWHVIDICEGVLLDCGWEIFERSSKGESATGKVYDLTDDMLFDCNDDVTRTLDQLREAAKGEEHLRCSASWLEGPTAINRTRCLVSLARSGNVVIWESMEGVSHHEKRDEPADYGPMIDRMAEKMAELKEKRRTKINTGDEFEVAATKLVKGFAYCPTQKTSVIPLYASSLEEGYQMQPFRLMFLPNCGVEVGPRGGEKKINPVDVWMSASNRITVDGPRMRPDMPRPLYTEEGRQYVNVYSPPAHTQAGGDLKVGLRFLADLVPDPEERDWFFKWLAFKLRYPHIPGPAVIMVAHDTFGTGRGTLAVLIGKLFGEQYVRQLDFDTFTGKTYQAQYNDWQAEALIVCVNESAETANGSTYQTKKNTYEHLKEVVEVRQTKRRIAMKGDKNFWALSSTSYLIFTNHGDALPIPEHDRRFSIITNGDSKPVHYWDAVNKWLEDPANVSALFNWLIAYDVEDYSPYAKPPTFEAKAHMIDEAKSDLDRAFELADDNLPGEVFTLAQMAKYVRAVADHEELELPKPFEGVFKKVARSRYHRVGERQGENWRVRVGGERVAIYAKSKKLARQWAQEDMEKVRLEVEKCGDVKGTSNVLAGFFAKHK